MVRVIDKSQPVMVTGATGYLASWIVKKLLEEGISVNATVRDPADSQRVAHLAALAEVWPGRLRLFKADLLDPGSFEPPMMGCELVLHTASPFFVGQPKDAEQELCRPAREGTRNVLDAANRTASVKRVVLTSSVAAIMGDAADIAVVPRRSLHREGMEHDEHPRVSAVLTTRRPSLKGRPGPWRGSRIGGIS